MIKSENRIIIDDNQNEIHVDGYFLTINDLTLLVRDFQADCFDGFVSNDSSYIELWLEKHKQIT